MLPKGYLINFHALCINMGKKNGRPRAAYTKIESTKT